jgi:hypothetical protein
MFMVRTFKKLAFALSVPAVLAVSGWAQLTTLTGNDATVAVSAADASQISAADPRIEAAPVLDRSAGGDAQPSAPAVKANTEPVQKKIVTYRIKPAPIPDRTAGGGVQPSAPAVRADTEVAQADAVTDPRTKPAVSPDRTAGDGAQPPVPAVKADTELAQADAVTYPRIKPAPSPDRTARDGATAQAERATPAVKANTESEQANATLLAPSIEPAPAAERGAGAKVALAEQQPSSSLANSPSTKTSSTMEPKKERQAALPRETKEDRSTRDREREGESRRSKNDAANARKTIVAMRQKAEPARYQWSGPAMRDHPMRLRAWGASSPATCH